jgi:hypothetical protein
MILEGLLTTENADGTTNVSPMGPVVEPDMQKLILRPFQTSTTYENLKRTGRGVFHVTDDVLLLAQAAVAEPDPAPRLVPAPDGIGQILADACRWYALRVVSFDESSPRSRFVAQVVANGTLREFFGFNRAKHAVVEAAILATRIGLLPDDEIRSEFARLKVPVAKTGGEQELAAFEFLDRYVRWRLQREEP